MSHGPHAGLRTRRLKITNAIAELFIVTLISRHKVIRAGMIKRDKYHMISENFPIKTDSQDQDRYLEKKTGLWQRSAVSCVQN